MIVSYKIAQEKGKLYDLADIAVINIHSDHTPTLYTYSVDMFVQNHRIVSKQLKIKNLSLLTMLEFILDK